MESRYSKESFEGDSDLLGSQNSLLATQELVFNVDETTQAGGSLTKAWGTLIPLIENLEVVELRGDSFQLGRDPRQCHVLLESHHLPPEAPQSHHLPPHALQSHHLPPDDPHSQNMDITCVSREHFRIFRGKDITVLEDLSQNGTFVNGINVGKNNKQMLRDGDTIGILEQDFCLYVFISEQGPRKTFGASLCDLYHIGSEVGSGATSCVYEAWRRRDYLKVAVKVINKLKWQTKYSSPNDFLKEVNILKNLDHPGIIKVLNVIETTSRMNIVMEFAEGGELFDMINEEMEMGNLDERDAKFQFYQICCTIAYLHSKDVCHRDLKLENLLLVSPNRKSQIKVSDFGLAKVSNAASVLESYVGTPLYMSPEIISSTESGDSYSLLSDCWSLGVILFTLLSGTRPFRQCQSEKSLHHKILNGNFAKMEGSTWDQVSVEAKNLVESLLVVNPLERLNASEIVEHAWFTSDKQLCEEASKVLFQVESNNDSGRGLSTKKVVTNLEVLNKGISPAKKRILSFDESDQKRNCPRKRIRVETSKSEENLDRDDEEFFEANVLGTRVMVYPHTKRVAKFSAKCAINNCGEKFTAGITKVIGMIKKDAMDQFRKKVTINSETFFYMCASHCPDDNDISTDSYSDDD